MADAEQIYQEVLTEEQGKGVSPAVAEGRAKAARSRAEAGSPHPKEPKWWPGAQPHLEGGGDGAAPAETGADAEAEAEEEAAPAEEPAAPEPQPSAPAAAAEAEPAPAQEAPTEEVAVEAAEQTPAAPAAPVQPAEQPAAVAAAPQPEVRPPGVTHGSTTGTRVRPEDSVTTEAQFQGQAAMYERRKLIDELIATGVPATAAAEAGERRSPMLAILYLLIPLLAIGIVLAQNDAGGEEEVAPPPDTGAVTLTAANVAFDTDTVTLPADEEATVTLVNDDSAVHNFSIYTDDSAENDLFLGQNIDAGGQVDYEIPQLEPGEYFFRCDVHPGSMTGTVTVE